MRKSINNDFSIIKAGLEGFLYKCKDFAYSAKDTLVQTGKGVGTGFLYGLLTPFDIRGGTKHLFENIEKNVEVDVPSKPSKEFYGDVITQCLTFPVDGAVFDFLPLELKAVYIGIAAVTNIAKYLNDVRKK